MFEHVLAMKSCWHFNDKWVCIITDWPHSYHELFTVCNGPILFLNGPNPASFCLFSTFSQHNDKYNTKFDYKKHRWCAWESNPGPQDGRHRWIHWAIAVPKRSNSYLFTPLQKTYFSAFTCFVLEKEKAFRRER